MPVVSVKGRKMKRASPHLEQKKGEEEDVEETEIIREEEERGPEWL